jgi:hypothetical protein
MGEITPRIVAIADLNRDGKRDLVTFEHKQQQRQRFAGNESATAPSKPSKNFGARIFSPISVAIADLNGDGKLDLVTANLATHNVSVLLGNGNGIFQTNQDLGVGANPD